MQFEFIDYSGCFPNLCAGKLTFKADGKQYADYVDMISGGDVWFDDHWSDHVEEGPWTDVSGPLLKKNPELLEHKTELLKMINENVPHGCDGEWVGEIQTQIQGFKELPEPYKKGY